MSDEEIMQIRDDKKKVLWKCRHQKIVKNSGGICSYCHDEEIRKASLTSARDAREEERKRIRKFISNIKTDALRLLKNHQGITIGSVIKTMDDFLDELKGDAEK